MSASYVRTKTREWCTEVSTALAIPFYDTINQEQAPTDNVWFTVEFFSEFHSGTFCNPGYIENGFVSIIVVAKPGRGDLEAIQAMEQIIPALDAKVDPTQRLVYTSYEPLDEFSGGTADKDYRVRVVINYNHSL